MSWILYAGHASPKLISACRDLILQVPVCFWDESESHFLAVGGPPETAQGARLPDATGSWAAAGLGLSLQESSSRPWQEADWTAGMQAKNPSLPLNGHFVAIRATQDGAEAYTDPLGLRSLYTASAEEGTIWTTHLPWMAKLLDYPTFEVESLGSAWLTFNALTSRACLEGVTRLGPGKATLDATGKTTLSATPWRPNKDVQPDVSPLLRALTRPKLPADTTLSLGLSGGLDSRLLLTFAHNAPNVQLHTMGQAEHPDVRLAQLLADASGLKLDHLTLPPISLQTCFRAAKRHLRETGPIVPASSTWSFRLFATLGDGRTWMIDGGFGEIGRRQFFNRLQWLGRGDWRKGHPAKLFPRFALTRADCFAPDVKRAMHAEAEDDIKALHATVMEAGLSSLSSQFDLAAVYTRLPFFFGYEQARLDGMLPNYMPFAQPALLDAVFATSARWRQQGRGYRRMIYHTAPPLISYPLVKGAHTYPYWLKGPSGTMYVKVKNKIRPVSWLSPRDTFLETVGPLVRERVAGDLPDFYDAPRLRSYVAGYYAGNTSFGPWIDWWLAFDIWYEEMTGGTAYDN